MIVVSQSMLSSLMTIVAQAASGVAGPLNSCKIYLFNTSLTILPTTPLSAFSQCTYTGYLPISITWGSPYIQPDGSLAINSQMAVFQPTADAQNDQAYGYYVALGTSPTVWAFAEVFSQPFQFTQILDALNLSVQWAAASPNMNAAATVIG